MTAAPDPLQGLRDRAAAAAFPTDGTLGVRGLGLPVTIGRDGNGALLIDAASTDDLWFAQGFATAGERLFQLELGIRAANGRLAETVGPPAFDADRFARTVGLHLAGEAYVASWTDEDHAMHGRFREGALAWLEVMPIAPVEYAILDLDPWLPQEPAPWAACVAYLAWNLSNNHDQELLRAWIRERAGDGAVAALLPPIANDADPTRVPGALHGDLIDALRRPPGQGSNAWVVSGSRTASGVPLLAADPHLLALHPSPWIEVALRAPGYDARGVALPFSPGVVIGSTPHHAWGITNVSGDVQDLFVERLDEGGNAALFGETWEPLAIRDEPIAVRGESEPRVHVVRETRHGPVLDMQPHGLISTTFRRTRAPADGDAYALAWAGRTHGIRPSIVADVARATSFEAFRTAALELGCPGQNFLYADVDGTIGYQCTGAYPIRARGDGSAPVPGWDGEHEWIGWIAPEDLPWGVDPARGFLVSANDRPHARDYPHLLSNDFHEPFRARRITELLEARDDHDVDSMRAIQNDTVSLPMRRLVPLLLDAVGGVRDDTERAALELLTGWDADLDAGSGAAALTAAWVTHLGRRALGPWLGDDLADACLVWRERWVCTALPAMLEAGDGHVDANIVADAFTDAVAELSATLGDDPSGWTWGALHRLTLAHPLAAIPGLEPLFVAASLGVGGDEQTVAQAGIDGTKGYAAAVVQSCRMVVDLADPGRPRVTLPAGNSGNPASAHWADQLASYANGDLHVLDADVSVTTVRLEPET
jgi:penicillin amidase